MSSDEKPNEAVIPEKPAEAAAELVEGRALAKRNAEQRPAARTQSRSAASRGLGSVRKDAPKCKVHQSTGRLHPSRPYSAGPPWALVTAC